MESLVGTKLLTKVDGKPVDTAKILEKKELVLLYFSATWCPPCKAFSPILAEFYKTYAVKEKLEIVYISSDRTVPEFESYYGTMPWTAIPLIEGSAQIKQTLAAKLGISGIPTLIVLDAQTGELVSATAREDVTRAAGTVESETALITKWKGTPRRPISDLAPLGEGNPLIALVKWILKNPMSLFVILYAYKYLKKQFAPPVDPYADVDGDNGGGGEAEFWDTPIPFFFLLKKMTKDYRLALPLHPKLTLYQWRQIKKLDKCPSSSLGDDGLARFEEVKSF